MFLKLRLCWLRSKLDRAIASLILASAEKNFKERCGQQDRALNRRIAKLDAKITILNQRITSLEDRLTVESFHW